MRLNNSLRVFACVSLVVSMAMVAKAADCGCGGMSNRSYKSLSGPPCFSPPGCAVSPGCCECPPSPCDNAWDGYCQHKAKYQACWAKFGTGSHCGCYGYNGNRSCFGTPTPAVREVNNQSESSSAPAVSPKTESPKILPPAPVPEKSARKNVLYPWTR